MKKMIVIHLLSLMLIGFAFFVMQDVHAATSGCTTIFCGGGLREGLDKTKPTLQGKGISTSDSIITVILGLVDFSLPFAGLFAFVGLIYGGFLYITSFAEDQTGKAKNIIMWSAFGIFMIFIAYPFVSTLIRFRS